MRFVKEHGAHDVTSTWQKVRLRKLEAEIECYKNQIGFDLVAQKLGVPRPRKVRGTAVDNELSD